MTKTARRQIWPFFQDVTRVTYLTKGLFMQRRFFSFSMALLALSGALSALGASAQQQVTLRVMTHDSFSLPKETLAQFEKKAGVKL